MVDRWAAATGEARMLVFESTFAMLHNNNYMQRTVSPLILSVIPLASRSNPSQPRVLHDDIHETQRLIHQHVAQEEGRE